MDDRFYTAFFPGGTEICGREVSNFSAYHFLILHAIGSPFLNVKGHIRPEDLLVALKVCRATYSGSTSIPDLSPSLRDLIWRKRLCRNKRAFRAHCEKFGAFMEAHASTPKFWNVISGGQKTRDLTGPNILILIACIVKRSSITLSEAWNMSFGQAQWISAEFDELDGSERRFLDENELKETEELS